MLPASSAFHENVLFLDDIYLIRKPKLLFKVLHTVHVAVVSCIILLCHELYRLFKCARMI